MKIFSLLLILLIGFLGAHLWYLSERDQPYFDNRCFANINYIDETENAQFRFNGNISIDFSRNKSGLYNLSGMLEKDGKKYTLSRNVKFRYTNISGDSYHITITSHEIMQHDTAPENISTFAVKMFALSGEYSMNLARHNDNYITIGNTVSPVMNCVIHA